MKVVRLLTIAVIFAISTSAMASISCGRSSEEGEVVSILSRFSGVGETIEIQFAGGSKCQAERDSLVRVRSIKPGDHVEFKKAEYGPWEIKLYQKPRVPDDHEICTLNFRTGL